MVQLLLRLEEVIIRVFSRLFLDGLEVLNGRRLLLLVHPFLLRPTRLLLSLALLHIYVSLCPRFAFSFNLSELCKGRREQSISNLNELLLLRRVD